MTKPKKKKDYRDAYKVVSVWPPEDNVILVDLESDTVDTFYWDGEGPMPPIVKSKVKGKKGNVKPKPS